jgi:S1-C subfamily serine protease
VHRAGSDRKIDVVLQETPGTAAEAKTATDDVLEYSVRGVTFNDRSRNRWSRDQAGVIVTNVVGGGWASLAGLDGGDLILEIEGAPVRDVASFKAAAERIQKEKPAVVRIFVVRGYRTAFVFAEPEY